MTQAASDSTVVLAVVGAGGWGKNHVRNFAGMKGVELRYVCDASAAVREHMAATHPRVRVVDRFDAVLEDAQVQAVVIATDAPTHFELARSALRRGKDVFVEKPMTLVSQQSAALCALADEGERVLMVGHLLLFHPAVEQLRALVDSGELGDILYLYSQRLNLGVVRRDENAWWSLAPHDVSVADYLFGASPTAVSATGAAFLQPDKKIEDVVFATLEYPGGRLAHVHVSWLDPHKTRRLTVVGSKKMAVFDDGSPDQKLMVFDKGVEAWPKSLSYAEGVRVRTGDIRIPAVRMSEPLMRECHAFVNAVRMRSKPLTDGRSGLAVVRTLECGTLSLVRGGERITTGGDEA